MPGAPAPSVRLLPQCRRRFDHNSPRFLSADLSAAVDCGELDAGASLVRPDRRRAVPNGRYRDCGGDAALLLEGDQTAIELHLQLLPYRDRLQPMKRRRIGVPDRSE